MNIGTDATQSTTTFKKKSDLSVNGKFAQFIACCVADNGAKDVVDGNEIPWTRTKGTLTDDQLGNLTDVGSDYLHYSIPLAPLAQFPSDDFILEVEVVLENSQLERRRLLLPQFKQDADDTIDVFSKL